MPVFAAGRRTNDWGDSLSDAVHQGLSVHGGDFSDEANIHRVPGGILKPEFLAGEDVGPGKPSGHTAQRLKGLHHLGVDFPRQDLVHHFDGRRVGDALSLDEVGLQACDFHGSGDGLASAVDDHRVNLHCLQKHDVSGDAVANGRIGRVHETATVLHHEGLSGEALDVGQGFQQGRCLGDQFLHRARMVRGDAPSCHLSDTGLVAVCSDCT